MIFWGVRVGNFEIKQAGDHEKIILTPASPLMASPGLKGVQNLARKRNLIDISIRIASKH